MNDIEFKVIDLETSIKNRGGDAIGKNKASPFHRPNNIVYYGEMTQDGHAIRRLRNQYGPIANVPDPADTQLVIGQNIKFDLLYMMRDSPAWCNWISKGKIWDTQLAEHILTAQQHKWANLDQLAEKYGGELKDDKLKELWDAGVDTEDIDPSIIEPYLVGDLKNTYKVFVGQIQKAKEMGLLTLIMLQMDALLATTEMEFNGFEFDKHACLQNAQVLTSELRLAEGQVLNTMSNVLGLPADKLNPGSAQQISITLFGGEVKEVIDKPILDEHGKPVCYKSGARAGEGKTRKETVTKIVDGFGLPPSRFSVPTKKVGIYRVDDFVINNIINDQSSNGKLARAVKTFCKDLLKCRKLQKDLKTYYIGYSDLVFPDGKIHPQFNHAATATGRLSHSAPNIGNTSHAD